MHFIKFLFGISGCLFFACLSVEASRPVPARAAVSAEIPAALRFYPVLPESAGFPLPVVKIREPGEETFGVDLRASWTKQSLVLDLDILDVTFGPVTAGSNMWEADSVQISLDLEPEKTKYVYTESCYEIGFALPASGRVDHASWYTGGCREFDWSRVKATGSRTAKGRRLRIAIGWPALGVEPEKLPKMFAMNILINDAHPQKGRRYIQWTPGTGEGPKDPHEYARFVLVQDTAKTDRVKFLAVYHPEIEKEEPIQGRYVEYALSDLSEGKAPLQASRPSGESSDLLQIDLPKTPAGQCRRHEFEFPPSTLSVPDTYSLTVSADTGRTQCRFVRRDLQKQIPEKAAMEKKHLQQVENLLAQSPGLKDDPYIRMGLEIARRFISRVQKSGPDGEQGMTLLGNNFDPKYHLLSPQRIKRESLRLSWLQLNEVETVLHQTEELIRERIRTGGQPWAVPESVGGPVAIKDGVLYADTATGPNAPVVNRPCYFYGMVGYQHTAREIPALVKLGANCIEQQEGPHALREDKTGDEKFTFVLDTFKRAENNRMMIDLMLSPHYFPGWPLKEGPDLETDVRGGFIRFNIDHPVTRKVVKQWIDTIVPAIQKSPSLLALCLSNEPTYGNSGRDKYSRPKWTEYLKVRHGTIAKLNALYGTAYKSFDDVPPYCNLTITDKAGDQRGFYDWCRFNQENFVGWHRWMHEIIKRQAPNIPTHIKILTCHNKAATRSAMGDGIDPELSCNATDLAGCDGEMYKWSFEIWYDLLHSFRGQPVANTENHVIPDGSQAGRVPTDRLYAVLWQQAIHHQAISTIWVWEEPSHPHLAGSIYFRPAAIFAAGKAQMDVNRLSDEMAALSRASAPAALLYSQPSIFWQPDYCEHLTNTYLALSTVGQPVTFVSEKQLQSNTYPGPKPAVIIVPHATHTEDATVQALVRHVENGGKLSFVGKECLTRDQYHQPRRLTDTLAKTRILPITDDVAASVKVIRGYLAESGVATSSMEVRDVKTGEILPNVEYRVVPYQGQFLISMINYTRIPKTVTLSIKGQGTDLISGRSVDTEKVVLDPITPVLLKVKP